MRPGGTGCVERTDRVDGEVAGEVVLVGFREAGPADDSRVVDEDVDPPEAVERDVDDGLSPRDIRDVAAIALRRAAGGGDFTNDLFGRANVRAGPCLLYTSPSPRD